MYAVVDTETTGLNPGTDRVLEIGVVLLDPDLGVERWWETLVQVDRDISNAFVHHIAPGDLAGAPRFADIARRLASLLDGRIIVAHNATFDRRFLAAEFARLGVTLPEGEWTVDTQAQARRALHLEHYSLADCLAAVGLTNRHAHTALADAEATAALFRELSHRVPPDPAQPLRLNPAALPDSAAPLLPRSAPPSRIERLTTQVPATGDLAADRYLGHLARHLVDGTLDADEVVHLHRAAADLGLSGDDVAALHEHYLNRLAVQAWADGVVTDEERRWLLRVAGELGIDDTVLDRLLRAPVAAAAAASAPDAGQPAIVLHPGDRISFTGALVEPREEWERRAAAAGLDVGGVRRSSAVLVAADPLSRSGKARKARELGVPILGESEFAQLLAAMGTAGTAGTASPEPSRFPWLPVPTTDSVSIARSWIAEHSAARLVGLSPTLTDATVPFAVDWSQKTTRAWLERFPQPLLATADDLLRIPGVGRVRLEKLIDAIVLSVIDEDGVDDGLDHEPEPSADDGTAALLEWLAESGVLEQVAADERAPELVREQAARLAPAPGPELTSGAYLSESGGWRLLVDAPSGGGRGWRSFGDPSAPLVPAPPLVAGLTGAAELLNLMGFAPGEQADPLAAVNAALGLAPGAPRRRAVGVLEDRGDARLAELLRLL